MTEHKRRLAHIETADGHLSYFVDEPVPASPLEPVERAPIRPTPAIVRYGADGSEDAVMLDRPAGPVRRLLGRLPRWM